LAEQQPQAQQPAPPKGDQPRRAAPPRDRSDRGAGRRGPQRRKGRAGFPATLAEINYKNVDLLMRFLTDRGTIRARRKTGANGKQQRRLAREIKRARHLALLPFTAEHIRGQ
jgi:small subunit ribosomal protein S18